MTIGLPSKHVRPTIEQMQSLKEASDAGPVLVFVGIQGTIATLFAFLSVSLLGDCLDDDLKIGLHVTYR